MAKKVVIVSFLISLMVLMSSCGNKIAPGDDSSGIKTAKINNPN